MDLQCGYQNAPDNGQKAVDSESVDGVESSPTGTLAISTEATQMTAEDYLNAGTDVNVHFI